MSSQISAESSWVALLKVRCVICRQRPDVSTALGDPLE